MLSADHYLDNIGRENDGTQSNVGGFPILRLASVAWEIGEGRVVWGLIHGEVWSDVVPLVERDAPELVDYSQARNHFIEAEVH